MNGTPLLASEWLKTKRSSVRQVAVASPLTLAVLALVQRGYFSLNLFNWFYVIFLPATLALMSAEMVRMDLRRHGLRTLRGYPVDQEKIWRAKLIVVSGAAFVSCLLLGIAVYVVPTFLRWMGIAKVKNLSIMETFLGVGAMYLSALWQVPFSFLLAKKLSTTLVSCANLCLSFSGVFLAEKGVWMFCPWAWVDRTMMVMIKVAPNGLPITGPLSGGVGDVLLAVGLSMALTLILSFLVMGWFGRMEGR